MTHGEFDPDEALLSSLAPTRRADPPIEAAELTALPLRGLRLAVFSACKGGQVGGRISGGIFGFPWALMAGGAEATVLSRWDVNGDSNGKWMGVFYREVASSTPASLAAATAMREMRKAGLTPPTIGRPCRSPTGDDRMTGSDGIGWGHPTRKATKGLLGRRVRPAWPLDRRCLMRKPNYRFERAERDRLKQAKKEEKAKRQQQERASDQKSEEAGQPAPSAVSDNG